MKAEFGDVTQYKQRNSVITSTFLQLRQEAIIARLNDFELLIRVNPLVQSVERLDTDPSSPSYKIIDELNFFGWTFKQSYIATFTSHADGISVSIKAGLGVTTNSRWVVEEDVTNGVKLSETSTVECPFILRGYVMSQIEASHAQLFHNFRRSLQCESVSA
jgi:hypothetical protein